MRQFKLNEDQVIEVANYFVEKQTTVRQVASNFGISKTTIHNILTKQLKYYNHTLYVEAKKLLKYNKAVRASRGGQVTKEKYLKLKNKI